MRKDVSRRLHRRLVLMSHLRHRIDGAMRPRQNAHRADARTQLINPRRFAVIRKVFE